jgi:hypothetical protein
MPPTGAAKCDQNKETPSQRHKITRRRAQMSSCQRRPPAPAQAAALVGGRRFRTHVCRTASLGIPPEVILGERGFQMLLAIAAILAVLWLLGFLVFHLGAIIHAVIVIAVVVAIFHFVRGRGVRV